MKWIYKSFQPHKLEILGSIPRPATKVTYNTIYLRTNSLADKAIIFGIIVLGSIPSLFSKISDYLYGLVLALTGD